MTDTHADRRAGRHRAAPVSFPDRVDAPFWDGPQGDAWDQVQLNGCMFPGMALVDGHGVSQKLDTRGRPGSDGARIVHKGYEPAQIDLTLRLWTEAHLEAFSTLLPQIHPRRYPLQRNAIDIYHPALSLLLIDRVVVRTIGVLRPSGTQGLFECKLVCIEYAPPTARSVTRAVQPPQGLGDLPTALPPPSDDANRVAPPSATNRNP